MILGQHFLTGKIKKLKGNYQIIEAIMKLTWKKEPISGQLVARSLSNEYKTYWIEEGAWSHLTIVDVSEKGPVIKKPMPFLSIEDAQEYAENQE